MFYMAGRSKKDFSERRTLTMRLRVTADEQQTFEAAARAKGLEFSGWARMILLESAPRLKGAGRNLKESGPKV
jgi:hypothetical protein